MKKEHEGHKGKEHEGMHKKEHLGKAHHMRKKEHKEGMKK